MFFSGAMPFSKWSFPSLIRLVASNNYLTGGLDGICGVSPVLRDLHLGSNLLSGTLPSCLGTGTMKASLQSLDLSGNMLRGLIPDSWSSLVALTGLNLGSNGFGQHVSLMLVPLMNLPHLTSVVLSKNKLWGGLIEQLFIGACERRNSVDGKFAHARD